MTKIKICGLRRPEDIEYVNQTKPDFCGFIVEVPKSSRNVTKEQIRELVKDLSKDVIPVGVFVNAPLELPLLLLLEGTIEIAQLHGQEDSDYIRELQKRSGKKVMKAFSVQQKEDVEKACESPADYILLDQGNGGTGKTFDWSLVPEMKREYFLAGGLGPENLNQAIQRLQPWAVDLSSSVETDGYKDFSKIQCAVNCVHAGEEKKWR